MIMINREIKRILLTMTMAKTKTMIMTMMMMIIIMMMLMKMMIMMMMLMLMKMMIIIRKMLMKMTRDRAACQQVKDKEEVAPVVGNLGFSCLEHHRHDSWIMMNMTMIII